MKKFFSILLACSMVFAVALAETEFTGALTQNELCTVYAPWSGTVCDNSLRAGDKVTQGDALLSLSTTKLVAPCDGTVEGMFAHEFDQADAVVSRYNALVSVRPVQSLQVSGTTRDASSRSLRDLTLGQVVYVKATSGSREGSAVIVTASEMNFSAEIVSGDLKYGDSVTVYSEQDRKDSTKIGTGNVQKQAPLALTGSGTVLKINVKNGDAVKTGDVLMELVNGTLVSGETEGVCVTAPVSGVISAISVQAGTQAQEDAPLLTIAPDGCLVAACDISEDDLLDIAVGDTFQMTLDLDEAGHKYPAQVVSIGYTNAGSENAPCYTAYLSFENDDFVREGMRVTIRK